MVTLKGELLNALEFLAGIYIRNPSSRNKIWLKDSGNIAIWYDSKLGRWIFGSHDDFGSPKTWIYSEDDVPGPQAATNWKYRLGRAIKSDNILVHSLVESGTLINKQCNINSPAFPKIITAIKSHMTCYDLNLDA